jgi:hypothetical protein
MVALKLVIPLSLCIVAAFGLGFPSSASQCSKAKTYDECVALGDPCSPCCNWNSPPPCNYSDDWIGCMDTRTEQCCTGNSYSGSVCSSNASCCMGLSWAECCGAGTYCCSDTLSIAICLPDDCTVLCNADQRCAQGGVLCLTGQTCSFNSTISFYQCSWPNGTITGTC